MNKWIYTKDQLPENRIGKIVDCEDGTVTMMYYDPKNKYWVDNLGFEHYGIVAWMDKPEPPL